MVGRFRVVGAAPEDDAQAFAACEEMCALLNERDKHALLNSPWESERKGCEWKIVLTPFGIIVFDWQGEGHLYWNMHSAWVFMKEESDPAVPQCVCGEDGGSPSLPHKTWCPKAD